MNRHIPFLCALLYAAFFLGGDAMGGTPTATANVKTKKCSFPKSRKRAPTWVCDAKIDGLAVTAVGSAARSRAGISFMERMATADACAHLAQNLSEAVQHNIAGGTNAANKDTADRDKALITRITDESLQGTKAIKRAYGPNGTLYVLVGLDEENAKKLNESISRNYLQQKSK